MSYTCPDCKDGILVAVVREIKVAEDEAAELVDGRVLITSVRCNNGCSPENEEEEEEPKPKKKTHHAPAVGGTIHEQTVDCDRPTGHTGRCNHNGKGS